MTRPKPVRHGKSRPPVRVPGGRGARFYTRTRLKMPRQDVGAIVSNYAASLRPPTFTTPAELSGWYSVDHDHRMVTVETLPGKRSAQIGALSPKSLARILLRELATEGLEGLTTL